MVNCTDHKLAGILDVLVRSEERPCHSIIGSIPRISSTRKKVQLGSFASPLLCQRIFWHAMQLNLYKKLLEPFKVKLVDVVNLHPNAPSYELVEVGCMEKRSRQSGATLTNQSRKTLIFPLNIADAMQSVAIAGSVLVLRCPLV
jgi:hypothetical protein